MIQGQMLSQLNLFTQGYFRVMVYEHPDWSGYVDTFTTNTLNPLTFTQEKSSFFRVKMNSWSSAVVGRYRFDNSCSLLLENKIPVATSDSLVEVTYTLQSNLYLQLLIDGEVAITKNQALTKEVQFKKTFKVG